MSHPYVNKGCRIPMAYLCRHRNQHHSLCSQPHTSELLDGIEPTLFIFTKDVHHHLCVKSILKDEHSHVSVLFRHLSKPLPCHHRATGSHSRHIWVASHVAEVRSGEADLTALATVPRQLSPHGSGSLVCLHYWSPFFVPPSSCMDVVNFLRFYPATNPLSLNISISIGAEGQHPCCGFPFNSA